MTHYHKEEVIPRPFDGSAHLVIDMQPWQLAIKVEGIEVSNAHFLCRLERKSMPADLTPEEVMTFIKGRYSVSIQLHAAQEDLPFIVHNCLIETSQTDASGALVSFRFTSFPPELEEMMQNFATQFS